MFESLRLTEAQRLLVERIERAAPQGPGDREAREQLYRELQAICPPPDQAALDGDTLTFSLGCIWAAQQAKHEREPKAKHDDWYWQRRCRLEALLEEIASDDLVRDLDLAAVRFYEPNRVDCPHDRRRKRCIAIREQLDRLATTQACIAQLARFPDAAVNPLFHGLRAQVSTLRKALKAEGIDPATAQPDDFCSIDVREPLGGLSQRPPKRPGAPTNDPHNLLLDTIGLYLCDAGCSATHACDLVNRVLALYFDENVGAETLRRQLYRRLAAKPPKSR